MGSAASISTTNNRVEPFNSTVPSTVGTPLVSIATAIPVDKKNDINYDKLSSLGIKNLIQQTISRYMAQKDTLQATLKQDIHKKTPFLSKFNINAMMFEVTTSLETEFSNMTPDGGSSNNNNSCNRRFSFQPCSSKESMDMENSIVCYVYPEDYYYMIELYQSSSDVLLSNSDINESCEIAHFIVQQVMKKEEEKKKVISNRNKNNVIPPTLPMESKQAVDEIRSKFQKTLELVKHRRSSSVDNLIINQ